MCLEGGKNSKGPSPQWEEEKLAREGRDRVSSLREARVQVEILIACSGGNGDSSESWSMQMQGAETGSVQWSDSY